MFLTSSDINLQFLTSCTIAVSRILNSLSSENLACLWIFCLHYGRWEKDKLAVTWNPRNNFSATEVFWHSGALQIRLLLLLLVSSDFHIISHTRRYWQTLKVELWISYPQKFGTTLNCRFAVQPMEINFKSIKCCFTLSHKRAVFHIHDQWLAVQMPIIWHPLWIWFALFPVETTSKFLKYKLTLSDKFVVLSCVKGVKAYECWMLNFNFLRICQVFVSNF